MIYLTAWDLSLAAALVLLLAGLSHYLRLELARPLLIAALRTTVQLLLIGLVLKALFENAHVAWVGAIALFMLLVAGREVHARQKWRLVGAWSWGVGTLSMFVSSFSLAVIALVVVIGVEPWYSPQYAIPLLGMLLGNTLTAVALTMDNVTRQSIQRRDVIEQRLALGMPWQAAFADVRKDAINTGMMPMINAMAAAGVVSLPGMMTGQILAGTPPVEAVKYQVLIMFLIASGAGFGMLVAVALASRRLFDERQRLRLERIAKA